jgi:hypothetical protein
MEVLEHNQDSIKIYSDDMPLDAWRKYGYDEKPEVIVEVVFDMDRYDEQLVITGAYVDQEPLELTYNDKIDLESSTKDYLKQVKQDNEDFFFAQ